MPVASEPTPPLPVRFRPRGVRVAAVAFGIVLVVSVVAVWLALPAEAQEGFTIAQKFTVVGMVLGAFVVGHALARCRVDATEEGLTVVNGYQTHRLTWPQVVAVTLRPGSPWAVLDLADGTTRSAMGIQGSDGERARRQTRQLRALIDAHAASDPR
jgi:Bacterial PH domain